MTAHNEELERRIEESKKLLEECSKSSFALSAGNLRSLKKLIAKLESQKEPE